MSRDFASYSTPPVPEDLRLRVLDAAGSVRREPAPLRLLDLLAVSRAWWLGWTAAVLVLALLGSGGASSGDEIFTAESWRRYRASVAEALGTVELAAERSGASAGGAA